MAKEYAKGFYQSKEWKKARQQCIKRANGLCERCRAAGMLVPGVIVHHKEYINPANIHDARITLDVSNMEYLCEDCHNKEHKTKPNDRYKFDAHGNLLPPEPKNQAHPRLMPIRGWPWNRGREVQKTPQGRTHIRGVNDGREKENFLK